MSKPVFCAWCGQEIKQEEYWIKDEWIDREDYNANKNRYERYPHAISGDEVHINSPCCDKCKEEGVC